MNFKTLFLKTGLLALWVLTSCKDTQSSVPEKPDISKAEVLKKAIEQKLTVTDEVSFFGEVFHSAEIKPEKTTEPVTVFAPLNGLWGDKKKGVALPDNSKPEDYMVSGDIQVQRLSDGQHLSSLSGKELVVQKINEKIYLNNIGISGQAVASGEGYKIYTISGLLNSANYEDPNSEAYFIEFYENGVYKKVNGTIIPWVLFLPQDWSPMESGSSICSPKINYSIYDNPGEQIVSGQLRQFNLELFRKSGSQIPVTETLYSATKSTNLTLNGATVDCSKSNSYFKLSITDVQITKDMGLEKKGYYAGEFEGVLYYEQNLFSTPELRRISKGKFMLPIGGKKAVKLSGSGNPPVLTERIKFLTASNWYLYSIYDDDGKQTEYWFESEAYSSGCQKDDYIRFYQDGIYLGDFCEESESGGFVRKIYTRKWSLENNEKTIVLKREDNEILDLDITELTQESLSIKIFPDPEEKDYYEIITYKTSR